jgi:hypothetical protein
MSDMFLKLLFDRLKISSPLFLNLGREFDKMFLYSKLLKVYFKPNSKNPTLPVSLKNGHLTLKDAGFWVVYFSEK